MSEYDYTFKIMVLGEHSEDKSYLIDRFCYNYFISDLKLTLGVDFHSKSMEVFGARIKFQLWEFVGEERFHFLLSQYCKGANAAFLLYDISDRTSLNHLPIWTQTVRENAGDIPIMLIGSKLHSHESRAVSRDEAILTAENYNLTAFAEISSEHEPNVERIFQELGKILLGKKPSDIRLTSNLKQLEFKVNDYLELRLENAHTIIYVGGRLFNQCKYLLLNVPTKNINDYVKIESIDEAAEKLDRSMEEGRSHGYYISPETEFWGHSSNLQVWFENNYDTRILHRNLSFPLLKALVKVGDPLAKKVFKDEIALRLESGYPSVVMHLVNQGYLRYLNKEELNSILDNPRFIKNLPKWFTKFKDIPKWLYGQIKVKMKHLKCPYCSTKISKALIRKFLGRELIRCEYCYTTIFKEV